MKLNVLCQSPVSDGMTQSEAIANTVELALVVEQAGYHRFWVAEHHSDPALASASPEIMVAHLAAKTQRMRIGSGGVLLPYYAPFKVAEQFALLAALHPDRIDLGLGRAGGSEGHAPAALGVRNRDAFAAVDELLAWMGGCDDRPFTDTLASPRDGVLAAPWMLGTSPASATYAGQRGLPYAFGGFLDPRGLVPALTAYHRAFRPSRWCERPHVNLGWYVQAAESEAEAKALTRSSEHWFIRSFLRRESAPFPDPGSLGGARYSPMEEMAIAMRRQFALVGTAEQVLDGLEGLRTRYAVEEFTLVTIPFEHEARLASYRLLSDAGGT